MSTLSANLDASAALASLRRVEQAGLRLRPLMVAIGEALTESTKQRFSRGEGPDGVRWLPNSPVTIVRYLEGFSSSFSRKTGKITAGGQRRLAGKRPLAGESGALATTINYAADDDGVSIGSPMIYAAVQQFGAAARSFGGKSPWGTIPARPFLGLSADDERSILELATDCMTPQSTVA